MGVEVLLFGAVGVLALAFAIGMLLTDNAVHSALFLIANFGCVAFLFLMLDAPFLSMVQIAVYAGAIMVLFLFVIMLLKAEQTSDTTTRRFPWLIGAGVTLAISLLMALALPLILSGFNLPSLQPAAPMVRFANVAAVAELGADLTGADGTTITIESVPFGDATDFESVAAGTYTVALRDAQSGERVAPPQQITLNAGDVLTLTATGELNLEASTFVGLTPIPANFREVGNNEGRLIVFNGLPRTLDADGTELPQTVSLVDLGSDDTLTTIVRDEQNVVLDRVVAADVVNNNSVTVVTYPRGTYNLAFVQTSGTGTTTRYDILDRLTDHEIEADTETLMFFVPDGVQPPASGFEGRKTVVELITFDTAAQFGSPKAIGRVLFTDYLLPVNLVGMLLLVALVGVILLSRPETETVERRNNVRRKVSRPLVNVISTQTGNEVVVETPKLPSGDS